MKPWPLSVMANLFALLILPALTFWAIFHWWTRPWVDWTKGWWEKQVEDSWHVQERS